MKLLKTTLCAAVATIAMTSAAAAAEFTYHVGAASDYVFRGVDQTNSSEGQLFTGVDMTQDAFYAGGWISNSGSGFEGVEYDLYAGWKPTVGGATLDLGIIYYGYANSASTSSDWNTVEFKLAGSVPVGPVTLGAAAYYSPDYVGTDESSMYIEANAAWAVSDTFTISGAVGQFSADGLPAFVGLPAAPAPRPDSYVTWNFGGTVILAEKISVDARYISNDDDAETLFKTNAFSGAVATIKYTF